MLGESCLVCNHPVSSNALLLGGSHFVLPSHLGVCARKCALQRSYEMFSGMIYVTTDQHQMPACALVHCSSAAVLQEHTART